MSITVGEGYGLALRSVMKGWVGVKFTVKRRYVTLEWPLIILVVHYYWVRLQGLDVDFIGTKTLRPDWQVSVRANWFFG